MMRALLLFTALITGPGAGQSQPSAPAQPLAEQVLRQTDEEQARLMQAGDADALAALLHHAYVTHAPDGRVYSRDRLLTLVRNGTLARERFRRTQEQVLVSGTTGIVIGLDRLEAPPKLARNGERSRRYTNVYVMQEGRWRLIVFHFHFLP
jgi:ketosteroid isomerase-like protein